MQSQTFKAGTSPGSPDNNAEIKTLILHCLSYVGVKVSFETLHEALRADELVNYFALVESMDQLAATGHIVRTDENTAPFYALTALGREAAMELKSSLPPAIREKSAKSLELVIKRHRRAKEVSVSEKAQSGGFMLTLSIPEVDGDIISIEVFAPTPAESSLIKKRFLNDPVYIYKGIMALLTGDKKIMGELFPEKEKLF